MIGKDDWKKLCDMKGVMVATTGEDIEEENMDTIVIKNKLTSLGLKFRSNASRKTLINLLRSSA